MKKNNYYVGLLAGMLTAGMLQGSDGENNAKGKNGNKTPKKLDVYSMQIVQQYMRSGNKEDLLNTIQVNKKFENLLVRNRMNMFPITKENKNMFPEIETQQSFGPEDYIVPGMYQYVIAYPVSEWDVAKWQRKLNNVNVVFNYLEENVEDIKSKYVEKEYGCKINHYICDEASYSDYKSLKDDYGNKIYFSFVDNVPGLCIDSLQEDPCVMQFLPIDRLTIKTISIPKIFYVENLISKFSMPNSDIFCTWKNLCGKSLENSTCKNFYGINIEEVASYSSRDLVELKKFIANVGYFPFFEESFDHIGRVLKVANFEKLYVPYYFDSSAFDEVVWMGGDNYRYLTKYVEDIDVLYTENENGDENIYIMEVDSVKGKLSSAQLRVINQKIKEIMANSVEVVFYTKEQIDAIKKQRILFYDFISSNLLEKYMQYINLDKKPEGLTQHEWDNGVLPVKAEAEKLMAVMRCEQLQEKKSHNNNGMNELMAAAINISFANEEIIAHELATRNLRIQNVTKDGNCGIYALLAGLHPEQAGNYQSVRPDSQEWRNAEALRQTLFGNDNALGQMVDNLGNLEQLNRWLALDNEQALQAVNTYVRNQGRRSLIILDTTVTAESGVAFTVVGANGEQTRYNTVADALNAGGNDSFILVYTPNHWKAVIPSNK